MHIRYLAVTGFAPTPSACWALLAVDAAGKSEQLLGKFIREYPGSDRVRDNLHVATKFAAYPWRIFPGSMVSACKGSLQRLGAEQLSIGQLHWSTANYQPFQVSKGYAFLACTHAVARAV